MLFDEVNKTSENCALLHAASGWTNVVCQSVLGETLPREDDNDTTVGGNVICRCDAVAFLTTFSVDPVLSFIEHFVPLSSTFNDLEIVDGVFDSIDGGFGFSKVGKVLGVRTS